MSNVISIGRPPWARGSMTEKLEEFSILYNERPIKNNIHGMKSPHLFMVWFALQSLKPSVIIESGVWRGQGTWLLEKACPNAQLFCIDIKLDQIQYKSKNATYFDQDFSTIDWKALPKKDTLLFFDDHQNAFERFKTAKKYGFRQMMFEDNYPPLQDHCSSLKTILMHTDRDSIASNSKSAAHSILRKIKSILQKISSKAINVGNSLVDKKRYLIQHMDIYYEFPPVFKAEITRWNDPWDTANYPTPAPLLNSVEKKYQQIYFDEAVFYTWMCYVKIKP